MSWHLARNVYESFRKNKIKSQLRRLVFRSVRVYFRSMTSFKRRNLHSIYRNPRINRAHSGFRIINKHSNIHGGHGDHRTKTRSASYERPMDGEKHRVKPNIRLFANEILRNNRFLWQFVAEMLKQQVQHW